LDLATMAELRRKSGNEIVLKRNDKTGKLEEAKIERGFTTVPNRHEDNEHSLEMHLPYIYKMMSRAFKNEKAFPAIVPILVGGTNGARERIYGKILAPYLKDPDNVFIVSSDFCHWGGHPFYYYYYLPVKSAAGDGYYLDTPPTPPAPPIHDSIRRLDRFGMDAIEEGNHKGFLKYLAQTHNSICGRHPIGIIMVAVDFIRNNAGRDIEIQNITETYKDDEVHDTEDLGVGGKEEADKRNGQSDIDLSYGKFKFVKYARSDELLNKMGWTHTSVSYAAAYAIL